MNGVCCVGTAAAKLWTSAANRLSTARSPIYTSVVVVVVVILSLHCSSRLHAAVGPLSLLMMTSSWRHSMVNLRRCMVLSHTNEHNRRCPKLSECTKLHDSLTRLLWKGFQIRVSSPDSVYKTCDTRDSFLRQSLALVTFTSDTRHTWKLKHARKLQVKIADDWWRPVFNHSVLVWRTRNIDVQSFVTFQQINSHKNLFIWPPPHTWFYSMLFINNVTCFWLANHNSPHAKENYRE